MKKVAHRIDENHLRLFGSQRLIDPVRSKDQVKTLFKWVVFDAAKTLGKSLCVTVVAARANLRTPGNRIPRKIRPFNR